MLGISQPQIHNVLKGARKLRPEVADRLIASLKMALVDLLETVELREQLRARAAETNDWLAQQTAAAESRLPDERLDARVAKRKLPSAEIQSIRLGKKQAS